MLEKISNVSYDLVHEPTDEKLRKSVSEGDQPAVDRAEFYKNLQRSGSQAAEVVYILDTRVPANRLTSLWLFSVNFSCPLLKSYGCSTEPALQRGAHRPRGIDLRAGLGGIWKTFFPRFFLTTPPFISSSPFLLPFV